MRLHYVYLFFTLLLLPFVSPAQAVNPDSILIVRDQWGVPHIYGRTDAEAAYGLAWANAEDNFEDIQKNLLISRARLGEIQGKEGALVDFAVHLIRARQTVDDRYESDLSPWFKEIMEAYTLAINRYAEQHPDDILVKGLFPAHPKDMLTTHVMSFMLMGGVHFDLINILDGNPGGPTPHSLRGSNGFALNSNITANQEVFLANNSHQPLRGPSSWYEAHINSREGLNCMGGLFPGGTSVFAGCNPNLGWMHTVNFDDYSDVYQLTMHPKEKNLYRFDGEWLPLEEKKVKLKVTVGPIKIGVKRKVWWSKYGATIKGKDKNFYSLRFAANQVIKSAEQWFRMNKAQNWQEFREILNMQGFASLNLVYADKEDNIFYLDNGLLPNRDPNFDWVGMLPGDTSATLWTTFKPVDELIQVFNPDCGYVYNTNNSPFLCTAPADRPDTLDYDMTIGPMMIDNNRGARFYELVSSYEQVSYEDFKRIKFDRSYPEDTYLYYAKNIEQLFSLSPQKYPDISSGIEILKNWDRSSGPESQGAAVFLLCLQYMNREVTREKLRFQRNNFKEEFYASSIQYALDYLSKYYGTFNVSLGDLQRHMQGEVDLPAGGLPDVIAAMYSKPIGKGKFETYLGDSYIQLIRFVPGEPYPRIESVAPYGASNVPGNPHYTDQMEMYVNQQLKTMSLDKEVVFQQAKHTYNPK